MTWQFQRDKCKNMGMQKDYRSISEHLRFCFLNPIKQMLSKKYWNDTIYGFVTPTNIM